MIEVKMARALTREGVEGVRWVLMDPLDPRPADVPANTPADTPAHTTADTPADAATNMADHTAAGPASSPAPALSGAAAPALPPAATGAASHGDMLHAEPHVREAPRQALMLGALKTLVVVVALGAAVLTAWQVIGPPRWPGQGTASGVRPVGPAAPAPAASVPLVTAWGQPAEGR